MAGFKSDEMGAERGFPHLVQKLSFPEISVPQCVQKAMGVNYADSVRDFELKGRNPSNG